MELWDQFGCEKLIRKVNLDNLRSLHTEFHQAIYKVTLNNSASIKFNEGFSYFNP